MKGKRGASAFPCPNDIKGKDLVSTEAVITVCNWLSQSDDCFWACYLSILRVLFGKWYGHFVIISIRPLLCFVSGIFRKKVLESNSLPNGHVETVVFALDCDQDFYLTANKNKDLELNVSKPVQIFLEWLIMSSYSSFFFSLTFISL